MENLSSHLSSHIELPDAPQQIQTQTRTPETESGSFPFNHQRISDGALHVLSRLNELDHEAYLVGGSVRDLLLDIKPKDFDVATAALPEQVRQAFPKHCRLIGRRFLLAHVRHRHEIIEVSTFRAPPPAADKRYPETESGRLLRDNSFGTLEQDARRRDFTVNALYYSITDDAILDFSSGLEDMKKRQLRMIGEPERRYREDPVRMLRVIRLACKLNFSIESGTIEPIPTFGALLKEAPPARLFDECAKLFLAGYGQSVWNALREYQLSQWMFPSVDQMIKNGDHNAEEFIRRGLNNSDARIRAGKSVNPAFLFAVLLWPIVQRQCQSETIASVNMQQLDLISLKVWQEQNKQISIPRRWATMMMEIWRLQKALENRRGKRAIALLQHPRFRAAYDFLLLRGANGEVTERLCQYWTKIQEDHPVQRSAIISDDPDNNSSHSSRRRRRTSKRPLS